MSDHYPPLVEQVQKRFRGQGSTVDRVFARSLAEQRHILSDGVKQAVVKRAQRISKGGAVAAELSVPIGLHVRDPWIRKREAAVRRLLDRGVLRTTALIEALLQVPPERFLPRDIAEQVLANTQPKAAAEGALAPALALDLVAMGLEALEPAMGDRVVDLGAASGWVAALLAELVGPEGHVLAVHPCKADFGGRLAASLADWPQIKLELVDPDRMISLAGTWDGIWLGAALPRFPLTLVQALTDPDGRAVTFIGPRFRGQDMVALTRTGDALHERRITRRAIPVLGGPGGWVPLPGQRVVPNLSSVRVERWPATAAAFEVLSHLDLGRDAANLHRPGRPSPDWVPELLAAYKAAPGRLAVHSIPLAYRDVAGLLAALRDPPPSLGDVAGRRLASAFADAIEQEQPAFARQWSSQGLDVEASVCHPLEALRAALYAHAEQSPPPLTVLDVPALSTHARGRPSSATHKVATSLECDAEHVIMQVFHEEVHVVTDPLVRADWQGEDARDTRVDEAGFGLHAELERVAISATHALLTERAPDWLPAFHRWQEGNSLRESGP